MAATADQDMTLEDEYDEEADSDFEAEGSGAEDFSSASDDDGGKGAKDVQDALERPRKRRKTDQAQAELITELDSGDEATIQELKQTHKKSKPTTRSTQQDDGDESEGWRARTRAMRMQEKDERRRNKLASSKGSTIDVNKIWEEMNQPAPLLPPRVEDGTALQTNPSQETDTFKSLNTVSGDSEKENVPVNDSEETITIKRTYKFAGEVHVEERTVLKSSAEAQLWLSQQQQAKGSSPGADGTLRNRPLRKISRFDPNFSNMDSFKGAWTARTPQEGKFTGPKLNVVEKSKMDWAEHVDTEGLKEELDTHAKAKEGYLTRMDFLRGVEERKESEARAARVKGRG
ncbi:swr complex subunit [Cladophialophora chaetospira]|uniref:SWR1-complex protein 5 n=1 Tax=Cladophialophora chaetospira TaxID=386627 RepID=A0AA38XNM0_9EURO|nr:swr complex subunit [Cladophialophora chaetospira]